MSMLCQNKLAGFHVRGAMKAVRTRAGLVEVCTVVSATYHRRIWSPHAASDVPAQSAPTATAAAEAGVDAHTSLHQAPPHAGGARLVNRISNPASIRIEQAAAVAGASGALRAAAAAVRERDSPEVSGPSLILSVQECASVHAAAYARGKQQQPRGWHAGQVWCCKWKERIVSAQHHQAHQASMHAHTYAPHAQCRGAHDDMPGRRSGRPPRRRRTRTLRRRVIARRGRLLWRPPRASRAARRWTAHNPRKFS